MTREEWHQKYGVLLGVAPDATREEVHSAYIQLIKKYHPDILGFAGLKPPQPPKLPEVPWLNDAMKKTLGSLSDDEQRANQIKAWAIEGGISDTPSLIDKFLAELDRYREDEQKYNDAMLKKEVANNYTKALNEAWKEFVRLPPEPEKSRWQPGQNVWQPEIPFVHSTEMSSPFRVVPFPAWASQAWSAYNKRMSWIADELKRRDSRRRREPPPQVKQLS